MKKAPMFPTFISVTTKTGVSFNKPDGDYVYVIHLWENDNKKGIVPRKAQDIYKDKRRASESEATAPSNNSIGDNPQKSNKQFSLPETDSDGNTLSEQQRYEILKAQSLSVVSYNANRLVENEIDLKNLETRYRKEANRILKPLARKLGLIKGGYYNASVDLKFNYSNHNIDESTKKQTSVKGDDIFVDFAKMLSCFEDVVQRAELIEVHGDKYVGTKRENTNLKRVYVLVSAFADGDYVTPVKLEIKELEGIDNVLYVSMTLQKIKKVEVLGQFMPSKTGEAILAQLLLKLV